MNNHNKILRISIIVMLLTLIISIISISKLRIDNQVFLKNYYEIAVSEYEGTYSLEEGSLILQYISNVDDNKYVTGITFKELPDTYFFATEHNQDYGMMFYEGKNLNVNEYGRYRLNTVYITCPELKYDDNQKEIILTSATVEFNDKSNIDIDLGKIVLYKGKKIPVALEGISYTSSSEGISSTTFRVKEDVKIESIESSLFEEASEIFDFNITYTEFNSVGEIKYEKGQTIKENSILTITSKYNGSNDILKNYTLYNISPNIRFINEYNDEYTYRYNNMESFNVRNYDSFYNSYGIYKYLKARGEL
ncbi:MAG: hypothetical protein E6176_08975 [Clostridium celatum]|uniref:hypothetical protein n=1 Tax=Clostridium sp. TaxID=1506 RepID=UPI00290A7800|nr:hypothetical protein [Clostridium celatum]